MASWFGTGIQLVNDPLTRVNLHVQVRKWYTFSGGQRSQRQKWFQCFESVNAILFLAAVNEYDQVLLEDRETSRIMESCAIFETIVNNLVFVDVAVIVFFNKTDLLEDKYRKCLISQYFPNFMGDPTDLRHVKGFLFDTFDQRRKDRSKSLYHHWTSVIDTQHTQQIFSYVREEIRRENLKQIGLFWCCEQNIDLSGDMLHESECLNFPVLWSEVFSFQMQFMFYTVFVTGCTIRNFCLKL